MKKRKRGANKLSEETKQAQENPQAEDELREETAAAESTQETPDGQNAEKTEAELMGEKLAELNDRLLRTMAEYDNFRKRSQREKESIYPQATANAVTQFVPIIDTFERALSAPCSDAEFKKGVEMILQHFKDALSKLGVEEFGAAGEAFNPELHNAVVHVDDEAFEANVIAEVFQKGYKLGDRVVRHAMVKVAN